jgi:hypothetical protein
MRPDPPRVRLALVAVVALSVSGAACRSRPEPRAVVAPPARSDVEIFSDLVDQLTRIGSHGAVDPKKEREEAR